MNLAGVTGGSFNHYAGGGANRLCLTKQPVFDDTPLDTVFGQLHGAQYYIPGHHYTDVVCAVCRTSLSVTYMVPGTNRSVKTAFMTKQVAEEEDEGGGREEEEETTRGTTKKWTETERSVTTTTAKTTTKQCFLQSENIVADKQVHSMNK